MGTDPLVAVAFVDDPDQSTVQTISVAANGERHRDWDRGQAQLEPPVAGAIEVGANEQRHEGPATESQLAGAHRAAAQAQRRLAG